MSCFLVKPSSWLCLDRNGGLAGPLWHASHQCYCRKLPSGADGRWQRPVEVGWWAWCEDRLLLVSRAVVLLSPPHHKGACLPLPCHTEESVPATELRGRSAP